ncbi:MAG: methionyl-tRNA formyltransferase [Pseudomonadota bacterium]|nr:methionyl-tRNA formyltransferase [Pseudomonadota bacterium]
MPARDLRLIFAGTPDFAARHLAHLVSEKFQIVSAYSQPDRPSGRGKKLVPTPVKVVSEQHGIPVRQPLGLDEIAVAELAAFEPDLMIVVAYGLLLPPSVLALPRFGCINVHASLLPRWRGAAPIERAILAGDRETGVNIMLMDAGLDTGPVLASATTSITPNDNSETLTERLINLGCSALVSTIERIAAGTAQAIPQPADGVTYAHKLHKEEAGIQWSEPATVIDRQIRAFYPRSPAFCRYQEQRLRILRADLDANAAPAQSPGTVFDVSNDGMRVACGTGTLFIREVQLEGKNPMNLRDLLNGRPGYFQRGSVLLPAG